MKHKHAEVIKAWADGAAIEFRDSGVGRWMRTANPEWSVDSEYRVKPGMAYPQTNIGHSQLFDIYANYLRENLAYTTVGAESSGLAEVANAAIRHAIDSGQVVVPESAMSQQK